MKKIIVGITGATGVVYGIRLLEELRASGAETHLILSDWAKQNILLETDYQVEWVEGLASFNHSVNHMGACVASGSFRTDGMVIAPCTVKTLSGIAHSYNQNLIIRAADVVLKEKRRLVLVVRETPLHLGHLKIMAEAAELGAIILPPAPAFYHRPKTIDDLVDHTVGRMLDLLDIEHDLCRRWDGAEEENREGPRESKRLIGILDRD